MEFNTVHSSAAAELAPVLAKIQAVTNQLAIDSLQINKDMVNALRGANAVQAKAVYESTCQEADNYEVEAISQFTQAGTNAAIMGGIHVMNRLEAPKMEAAESRLESTKAYESALSKPAAEQRAPVIGNKTIEKACNDRGLYDEAKIRKVKSNINKLKNRDFTDSSQLERDAEGNPTLSADDQEAIQVAQETGQFDKIKERVEKQKEKANEDIQSISRGQSDRLQKSRIYADILSNTIQGTSNLVKSENTRLKAYADKVRTQAEYLNSVFQQMMQTSLQFYNSQESAVHEEIQTQGTIAQLNRAA